MDNEDEPTTEEKREDVNSPRSRAPYALYVTDAEMIRRMGVPEKIARVAIYKMDRDKSGFPQKDKLFGNRRYWPAVRAYLDRRNGLGTDAYRNLLVTRR